MSGIRTNAAAVMLGVSPNTLRRWERRYGFPRPSRTPGGHRQYALGEVESLRATLAETHNISSAIVLARQRGEGPSSGSRLAAAFATFDEDKANGLLEESLALRSVERTIEAVLLEAVAGLDDESGPATTPEYEFGWRYATAWLSALKRLSPPATRSAGVLVLDASAPLELDGLYAQSLELMLRRAGVRTVSLSTAVILSRLAHALPALAPSAVVLAGRSITLDALGRLVYSVRSVMRGVQIFDFRGAVPATAASTVRRLGQTPMAARDLLLVELEEIAPSRPSPFASAFLALTAR
jgi:DNA-binding transcriptional MerR regulator